VEQAITMGLDPVITMAVQVITMPWNERSRWSGLADHDAVESVATIAWRAHLAEYDESDSLQVPAGDAFRPLPRRADHAS
jgi:hypothetical protein